MKRLMILLVLIILLAAGWYAYRISTGKVKSLTEVEATTSVKAPDLIKAFEKDSAAANRQYLGKIIEVTGNVKSIEKEEKGATVILGEQGAMSSVRCSFDTTFVQQAQTIKEGSTVIVKGACTGYNADEMGLGSDVVLNRCVLQPSNK